MTLTTYDEDLCAILEPHVCTTKRRAEALKIMHEEGIPTIVWMTTILPFINDTKENVKGLLDYCIQSNVYGILCFNMGLTLRDGDRQYYYRQLDEHFPGLKRQYMKRYGYAYEIPSPNSQKLLQTVQSTCKNHGMVYNTEALFKYMHTFEEKEAKEQLKLF
jgi:DNA repair photolyase